jgi:AMP-polyphosphate phosphotransferase
MFESAELGHTVDDATYAKAVKKLRGDLLDAQFDVLERKSFPVLVLVNGVDAGGKGETVNLLSEWLDPRHIRSRAFGASDEGDALLPKMWRFWHALPPKGKIGVFFGNWYSDPIVGAATKKTGPDRLAHELERIRALEQMLVDDGTVLVKLWFHLSKKAQKKRLTELEKDKLTRWRVTPQDWKNYERYDRFHDVSELVLRETSTGSAPWLVIDGSDANYRALTAGRALLAAMRAKLSEKTDRNANGAPASVPLLRTVDTTSILSSLKFEERLSKEKYGPKVLKAQSKLARLSRSPKMKKRAVVCVFEGSDAAGKGGAIRRITQALDARLVEVIPIAAPTDEERAQPYLWRFWRNIPRLGHFAIFDRSWYGRVLVERVERFASEAAWSRAYHEINEFEEQLADGGVVLAKFWLAITKEEQAKRFKEREETRYKQYKITSEDWRNRKRWDEYVTAASDMIDRTSTPYAPWTVIEANDKHLARVRVIETLAKRMEDAF